MAGDIGLREKVLILGAGQALAAAAPSGAPVKRQVVHMYGDRVMIVEDSPESGAADAAVPSLEPTDCGNPLPIRARRHPGRKTARVGMPVPRCSIPACSRPRTQATASEPSPRSPRPRPVSG